MKKRNFLTYTFTPRHTAMLALVGVLYAFITGVCKVSGYGWFVRPLWYTYLFFCTAFLLKNLIQYIRYTKK